MEIKMGDIIKTLVDKEAEWDEKFIFPKGSRALVCEVYEGDAILVETEDKYPFALVTYKKGEYEKISD